LSEISAATGELGYLAYSQAKDWAAAREASGVDKIVRAKELEMSKTFSVWIGGTVAALIVGSPLSFAQTGAQTGSGKTSPAAASRDIPRRDISGTWTPEIEGSGIGGPGPYSMPSDGKHEPPYTALAR